MLEKSGSLKRDTPPCPASLFPSEYLMNGMLREQEMPSLVCTSDTEEESDIFLTSLPTISPNFSSGVPQQNEFDIVAPPCRIRSDNQADAILNKFVLIVYRANDVFALTIFLVYNFF